MPYSWEDEARVQRDCKYEVKPFLDNRAQSLGGYMWAISSIEQEQLQIRCLEETHVIQIRPPLQVVYVGNGCEGYSPQHVYSRQIRIVRHRGDRIQKRILPEIQLCLPTR